MTNPQFSKRSGSTLRDYNIKIVMDMLKEGKSDDEILTELGMLFCRDTRTDYLDVAKHKLLHEEKNNNSKEIKQPKTEKKSSKDYSIDLIQWIKTNNYQNLNDNELIEKIKQLTNEELKQNWIKQIKGLP